MGSKPSAAYSPRWVFSRNSSKRRSCSSKRRIKSAGVAHVASWGCDSGADSASFTDCASSLKSAAAAALPFVDGPAVAAAGAAFCNGFVCAYAARVGDGRHVAPGGTDAIYGVEVAGTCHTYFVGAALGRVYAVAHGAFCGMTGDAGDALSDPTGDGSPL